MTLSPRSPRKKGATRNDSSGRNEARRQSRVFVGCDVGGTALKALRLVDRQPAGHVETQVPRSGGPRRLVAEILRAIEEAAGGNQPPEAVTVAVPGFLDEKRETLLQVTHLPELVGVPLRAELEAQIGAPVRLETDANAAAVAEARLGSGQNAQRVLYVSLGTGVGASLCVDGHPVRVSHHAIGHVAQIPLGGDLTRDKAERQLSARGIVRRARAAGLRGVVSPEDVYARARVGVRGKLGPEARSARQAWRETGEILGRLIFVLGTLFRPDAVVVGGGTSAAAPLLLPTAERHIRGQWPTYMGQPPGIHPASHGRWAGALGAAYTAQRAETL